MVLYAFPFTTKVEGDVFVIRFYLIDGMLRCKFDVRARVNDSSHALSETHIYTVASITCSSASQNPESFLNMRSCL